MNYGDLVKHVSPDWYKLYTDPRDVSSEWTALPPDTVSTVLDFDTIYYLGQPESWVKVLVADRVGWVFIDGLKKVSTDEHQVHTV